MSTTSCSKGVATPPPTYPAAPWEMKIDCALGKMTFSGYQQILKKKYTPTGPISGVHVSIISHNPSESLSSHSSISSIASSTSSVKKKMSLYLSLFFHAGVTIKLDQTDRSGIILYQ